MIDLQNIYIDYPLDPVDGASLKQSLLNALDRNKGRRKNYFRALDNISLKIQGGERVGLIGLNGAGKSTLLRVMSRIFQPTSGFARIDGRVSPLLDMATGFELHHTGVENIRTRLMFLGESQKSIEGKIDEIAKFSELGDFLHQTARTYSTGMFMRLAFATSTAIRPDILIADEIIGTGDAQFSDKAEARIAKLLSEGKITIISSHSMGIIRKFCNRVIWLHHGKIISDGPTEVVINEYENRAPKMIK
ncbi:ABC transporter ATP-binding protein [Hoeflea sp. TYP-13]|uniref:ABC transporter ATP-binding protein n=1 Tax=Hoeflea sp. TYP-13 TaxID=3230023 RepID=UPI0034C5B521